MSPTSRRLVLGLRLLALFLVMLFLLAPALAESQAWGLWPATYVPRALRWACAALAAGLALFGDRLPRHWPAWLPRPAWPHLRLALALLAAVPFYLLRIVHTRWGDAYILVNSIPHPDVHLTYSWQAPLDVYLHAKVWALGHAWFGWADAMPAYWLISTVAGVVFVWVLLGLAAWLGRNTAERVVIAGLVGTLGLMQLFFGYVENYTLMTLGVLIYAWLALRSLRGEIPLYWPALALALTNGCHPATIVLTPSLLYVWWVGAPASDARGSSQASKVSAPSRVRRRAATLLAIAVPYAAVGLGVLALMTAGGHGLQAFLTSDAPGGADHNFFVPLAHTTTRWEHYTMFSMGHLMDMVNEQLLAAPAILPALLLTIALAWPCVRATWAGGGMDGTFDGRAVRFLTLMTAFYLLLIWIWNPDYGGQRDWDLFAPAALPAALLLAFLLPRALPERPALRAAGWALISVQALHTGAWIYQNTRPWSWS